MLVDLGQTHVVIIQLDYSKIIHIYKRKNPENLTTNALGAVFSLHTLFIYPFSTVPPLFKSQIPMSTQSVVLVGYSFKL